MLDFGIEGIDDALKRLARAVQPVNDRRIGENAARSLEPVAEEARRLVPVDSGDLRESIGVSFEHRIAETDGRAVYVGPIHAGVSPGLEHVFYAHFIEFGTVKQRAQPFLAPAVFKHRDLVFESLGNRVGEDIYRGL